MPSIDTVVIGAGQAGLAMSRCLTERALDHVVLERGRVAERWRSERWDSLRLLTPSWQSRLPGWAYRGPDPDGFMTMPEVISYLEGYARSFDAPVVDETTVVSVAPAEAGFAVTTDQGTWTARNVVVASGQCDVAAVPSTAAGVDAAVHQVTPPRYRNPSQLPAGGVLVVGASATGVQLADEIHRSGRPVTLAVGSHTRLPRRYRGLDIMWWLDRMGVWDTPAREIADVEAARRQPSLQLVGTPSHRDLDLAVLQAAGVRLAGRVVGVDGTRVGFADDLGLTTARADQKLRRLLGDIDRFAAAEGLSGEIDPADRPAAVPVGASPAALDLRRAGITSVVWATGYVQDTSWLHLPVTDERGAIRHHAGITAVPGLYVLGLRLLRTRKSSFIDGVGDDARAIADHLRTRGPAALATGAT